MFICTLKVVRLTSLDDTVKVMVAATDCPGWRSVFCWFHVTVIGPFAVDGFQLLVVMFRLSERPLLVFLM